MIVAEERTFPTLPIGAWVATEGRASWRKPHMRIIYNRIRRFSAARYKPFSGPDMIPTVRFTHVRINIGYGQYFEMTYPRGRFGQWKDAHIAEKFERGLVGVAYWPNVEIDVEELRAECTYWSDVPYDLGDLADFLLVGLANAFPHLNRFGAIRLFGDRTRRFGVCSTIGAVILNRVGVPWEVSPRAVDPSLPFNQAATTKVAKKKRIEVITNRLTKGAFYDPKKFDYQRLDINRRAHLSE